MIQRRSEFKSCSVFNVASVSPALKPSLKAYSDNACLRSDNSEHRERPSSMACVKRDVTSVFSEQIKAPYYSLISRYSRHATLSVIFVYIVFLTIPTIEGCYVFPKGKKDPCQEKQCYHEAICVSSSDGKIARCHCIEECNNYGTSQGNTPICGDDGLDYDNLCELKKSACKEMLDIKIKYYGRCDPCDGIQCQGQQVCRLNDERQPVCECEASCDPLVSHVCGSDGRTYSNECILKQQACQREQDTTVRYPGPCQDDNPCSSLQCGPNHDCLIDRMGQAACVCPSVCDKVLQSVCGTDGLTYDSACELRRQACQLLAQTTIDHMGPCEISGVCRGYSCDYDGVCAVENGRPVCHCPVCNVKQYDPVCGDNGITYHSECELKAENCEQKKTVQIEHRGLCTSNGCERNSAMCKYHSTCQRGQNGLWRCVCPSDCPETVAKVCGTDGVTYDNECRLRMEGCRKQMDIVIDTLGECVKCNDRYCKYGAKCESGQCQCPQKCHALYDPICASDGETYRNDCEMKKAACRQGQELRIVKSGDCDDDSLDSSAEGSGYLECDETTCQYGGTCQLEDDGGYRCVCSFSCDAIRSPVCGSDGNSYGNKCELQAASCQQQKLIMVQAWENCDFDEDLCDGANPMYDAASGTDYTCDSADDCPAGSYCHLQFRRCCSEERMSDTFLRDCSESEFGCCDDHVTFANGPNKAGCPDTCQCEPIGSLSTTCHADTKQCTCKPGVGGKKCDRCLGGYWGLNKIQGNSGCRECNCNEIGATRRDCDQMTGRCMCKEGYDGHKCHLCEDSKQPVGRFGCYGPQTCDDLICLYGATCRYNNHFPQCVCDFSCDERDFRSSSYVCASNGITYINECKMRKDSCLTQRDIRYSYSGPCQANSATPFPITTRSRKTTRRDITPNAVNTPTKTNTPKPPTTKTDEFGRIDDLCLENSYCSILHSHCHLLLCKCDAGYIPTMQNTMCSPVESGGSEPSLIPVDEDSDPCELNNCRLYGGICKPDEDLGYRCLCSIGRTGIYCKEKISFKTPSFSGSSYMIVEPLGKISGDFYLNIVFHAMNRDGVILYSSQSIDGTGQFISLALSNGHIEFRYDTGGGPKQIGHPQPISQEKYHRVTVKKMGENAMLIVDEREPMAIISLDEQKFLDLSGKFYLGSLPQNLSFIQEKIGMNLGFVGCIRSLTAGHMDNATIFNLEYPSVSSHIVDGIDIAPCEMNPCQSIPCMNGGTCNMINPDKYQCWCPKGYTGENCGAPVDPCTNSPCHPSATCEMGSLGDIICICPAEREGNYCEYEKLSDVRIPEFFGDSYLVLHVPDSLARQMSIEIWFLTHSTDGVLMFTTQYIGGGGDFVSLNLVESFLEFRFDLGDGPVVIRSADRIRLNKWHKVTIQRMNREADLVVDDGEPSRGMSQGSLSELQFSGGVFIGGFDNERDLPLNGNIKANFTGVIQRLYINGALVENMIDSALEKFHVAKYIGTPCNVNPCMNGGVCMPKMEMAECKCPKKYIGQHCEKVAKMTETSDPVRFTGQTYLQYFNEITQGHRAQKSNKFQFRFKTHQNSGLLIFQNQGSGVTGDYFALAINGGFVELSFNLGKQTKDNLLIIRSKVYVSDGEWHTVSAERERRESRLQVDKETLVTGQSDSGATQLDTDSYLWIGGKADLPWGLPMDYYAGFSGCLGDVFIKDKELHLFEHRNGATSTVIDFCH